MANKEKSAKKIDLSSIKKINFAKIKKLKSVNIISKVAIYFVLICIGYVYLKPIFEMISKSIMTAADLIDPSITWIAKHPTFSNFVSAVKTLDVPGTLLNSIWFSGLLAIAQTAVSAMTGFALSRYSFRGRNIWYIMLILAFILPVPLLTVPRLMIFNQLYTVTGIKLIGSIGPQFIMALLGQGTYSTMLILIFYNFFNMIPKSLDEAAMIDGAGSLKVFYHVAIRLSLSTILVVFLFSFVFNWNETYTTNTMLRNAVELLPVKLSLFDNSSGGVTSSLNEAQKMAATLISIAPLLVLYALVQKQFIQGIENTGITGE
jgi:multiple sugar transport system permease protein